MERWKKIWKDGRRYGRKDGRWEDGKMGLGYFSILLGF